MTERRFAAAADGETLSYAVQGNGPARIALTHSLAMTGEFWRPVAERIASVATVLTWDCRGHGASSKAAGAYTVEQFGDDLAAVLDDAGWDQTIAGGASMGGTVTLAFAARHPTRVQGLALIDTTATYGEGAAAAWRERADKARAEGLRSLTAFQQTRWFGDVFRREHPETVAEAIETFCANDIDAYAATCAMLGNADLSRSLSGMKMPAMILVGEEDYATPVAMAQAMHDALPSSTLEIIPGARHLTPLECPDLVADRIASLVAKVVG